LSQTVAVWLVLLLALVSANLPFITQRLFGVAALRDPKGLALRLLELLVFYVVVGGVALLLENRAGQITAQGWEFYAITLALFVTLSFPGFVYRYLLKRQGNV
jgi:Protein of unknown function (DUF2818)